MKLPRPLTIRSTTACGCKPAKAGPRLPVTFSDEGANIETEGFMLRLTRREEPPVMDDGSAASQILRCTRTTVFLVALSAPLTLGAAMADPERWRAEWPRSDFSRHTIPLEEIKSGGPRKDGIPSIDMPRFEQLKDGNAIGWAAGIGDIEPVISLVIRGD